MGNCKWSEWRLGDLIKVKHGWPFKSKFFSEELTGKPIVVNIGNFEYTGGFRFSSTTVKEYRDEYPVEYELTPGEILLIMTCQTSGGEILGIPARVPADDRTYLHNQRLGRVHVKLTNEIDRDFLYWLFLWSEFNRELFVTATGTKILHTAPIRIENFRFNAPPLPEQERIADILGTLDDKIELNRRMNETLETMARRLFKSWFVDFDPVKAKAALREKHPKWTNERLSREALPNLDPKIAELFPDALVESELGEIPEGWRVGTVGDVVTLDKTSVKPLSHPDELFDHYSIPSHDNDKRPVTELGLEIKSNKFLVTEDCVLLTKLNPRIRRIWLPFPETSRRSLCSTEFLVLKSKAGIQREFTYSLVSSNYFFNIYETMVTGTSGSHQRIRPDHLLAMNAVIPSIDIATAYSNHIDGLLAMQNDLRTESEDFSETRDKLLPKLLSGELTTSSKEGGINA